MTDNAQFEKPLNDLLDEFNTISVQADELRRRMKDPTKQIEARANTPPIIGRSSQEIGIPQGPFPPIQS